MALSSNVHTMPVVVLDAGDMFTWGNKVFVICAPCNNHFSGDVCAIQMATERHIHIAPQMYVQVVQVLDKLTG